MGMDAALATLGLAVGAQPNEITRAFRAHSRASHPDRGGDRRQFEAVLHAYRELQRAGLVDRGPARVQSSHPPIAAPHPAERRYRDFVRDLERVAAIVVIPAAAVVHSRRTTAAVSVRTPGGPGR